MGLFKKKYNPLTPFGFNLVPKFKALRFLESVANEDALPTEGNEIGDARFTKDNYNLWVWNGESWENQGNIVDLTWDAIEDKPDNLVKSDEIRNIDVVEELPSAPDPNTLYIIEEGE